MTGLFKYTNNDLYHLWSLFDVGNVRLDSQRPVDVQSSFVELKQEDDEDEEGVEHEEKEDRLVAQFDQISCNTSLKF